MPHTLCQHWRSNYLARGAVSCLKDVLDDASRPPDEFLKCFPSNEISRLADVPGRPTSCVRALCRQRRLPRFTHRKTTARVDVRLPQKQSQCSVRQDSFFSSWLFPQGGAACVSVCCRHGLRFKCERRRNSDQLQELTVGFRCLAFFFTRTRVVSA